MCLSGAGGYNKGKFPRIRGETKPCTTRRRGSFGRECRKNSTHTPKLRSKGKFIRKGVTLHRVWCPPRGREWEGPPVFREFSLWMWLNLHFNYLASSLHFIHFLKYTSVFGLYEGFWKGFSKQLHQMSLGFKDSDLCSKTEKHRARQQYHKMKNKPNVFCSIVRKRMCSFVLCIINLQNWYIF